MNKKNRKGKSIWGQSFSGETLSCESVNLNSPDGIDLRDRFAMEMMKIYLQKEVRSKFTLINRIKSYFKKPFKTETILPNFKKMAHICYECADTMMNVRKENEQ